MQGIMFSAGTGTPFAVTAARDMIQLVGSATTIAAIHEVRIGQEDIEGDAVAEMIDVHWFRSTSLGAGTAGTESPLLPAGTAANSVVINGAVSTGLTQLGSDTFNLQAGWLYLPTPAMQPVVSAVATEGIVFQISAPDASTTFSVSITWEEFTIT